MLAQVDIAHLLVGQNLVRGAECQHRTLVDDVCADADAESLADVVVGDQDADAAFRQLPHNALNIHHGDRVDAGKRLVEEDEFGP